MSALNGKQYKPQSIEMEIRDYVYRITGQTLNRHQCTQIKDMVLGADKKPKPSAVIYKYVPLRGGYEHYRTVYTDMEQINRRIAEALEKGPVEGFYEYRLFDAAGNFQSSIYSVNPSLFD